MRSCPGLSRASTFLELGLLLIGPLKIIKIFEKQNLRRLLGVVQFCGAHGFLPQKVVNILKGLFGHVSLASACDVSIEIP
jgi:hypothetical protein